VASLVESQGYAGDEGNFEALYSTYRSDVQRLASYLLKNAADAEDASQTVFVNVLRALRQGVRPAEPRAWLMAITRNVCFSRRRAVSCRPAEVELDADQVPEALETDAPAVDDIVGALTRMLPNQRTALILRDFRGASHSEICELLELSPAGIETLLTRARISFREEMEAGDQPFDCTETRALVEQQLAGEITVSERHSLRTHLRHCGPCSALARAVRSSKGKLAGLLVSPVDLFQRLASALSQAPSVVHVAAAVTSTAAIATVAIPVVVTHVSASSSHLEGRAAPGTAAVIASHETTASHTTASSAAAVSAGATTLASHVRTSGVRHPHAAHAGNAGAAARAAAGASVALATATPAAQAAASTGVTTAPVSSIVHQVSPHAAAPLPALKQPVAVPPRSPAPAVKPAKSSGRARKTKPAARHRPVEGRHPTDPAEKPPASSDPLASLPTPSTSGPASNSGSVTLGSESTNTTTQSTDASSSSSGQSSGAGQDSSAANGSGSSGSGNGGDSHSHKKPKHGH
jgi:RNA polymerase sigma factor (sigma-70 family)